MQEEAEEQKEVIGSIHVFTFDADDARTPEWADVRLINVVPRETTELAYVLHHNHHLQASQYIDNSVLVFKPQSATLPLAVLVCALYVRRERQTDKRTDRQTYSDVHRTDALSLSARCGKL